MMVPVVLELPIKDTLVVLAAVRQIIIHQEAVAVLEQLVKHQHLVLQMEETAALVLLQQLQVLLLPEPVVVAVVLTELREQVAMVAQTELSTLS
jgi:hypothetical protein